MAALDPFDMLVRLGKVTQEQLQAADLVETGLGTSSRAARLVAVGVDKDKLLQALADLTRMPIAPPAKLQAAAPMKLPTTYSATMKELLAVPIGRVDEHILEVAVADPRTSKKLRDAAIAHRPFIAIEADIIDALGRVFPDAEVLDDPFAEPTLRNVAVLPRPVSVVDGAAATAAAVASSDPSRDDHGDELHAANEQGASSSGAPQPVAIAGASDPNATIDDDDFAPLVGGELLAPISGELAGGEPRAPVVGAELLEGSGAPSSTSPSPFAETKIETEETERVRERGQQRAASATASSSTSASSGSDVSVSNSSSSNSSSTSTDFAERVRGVVKRVREGSERMDARRLSVFALIGIAIAVAVLAFIVLRKPSSSAPVDAGVVVVDAGVAEVADAGVEDAGTKPVAKPKPHKPPPRRVVKKKAPHR